MGALERMVVLVTPEQKASISARARAEKVTMGELVRRSVEQYSAKEDETVLLKLIEQVNASTARADRALDDALAALTAGMARIEKLERSVRRASKRAS
jgi:hypothetical protein